MFFIGFDPGTANGMVCLLSNLGKIIFNPIPLIKNGGKFSKVDHKLLYTLLLPYSGCEAVLETVRITPRDIDHLTSAENLVRSHESILCVCDIVKIKVRQLEPSEWRKQAGSYSLGSNKSAIVDYSLNLFPDAPIGKNSNKAESLLMARVCQQIYDRGEDYRKIAMQSPGNRDAPKTFKGKAID